MKAKITTNTNLIAFSRDGNMLMKDIIPILSPSFDTLDLNFCELMNPSSSLLGEDAEEYLKLLEDYKREYSVTYFQCHVPYPRDYLSLSKEEREGSDYLILKALEYSERLGITQAVIHPIKGTIKENIHYFENILNRHNGNITLAIENMETPSEITSAKELLEITDALSPRAGICLDTGHANVMHLDLPHFIEECGTRLIATHISDNNGQSDQHLLPGLGNINWEEVISAFKWNYGGYLNYEAMYFGRNLPSSMRPYTIFLAHSIASWLLSL